MKKILLKTLIVSITVLLLPFILTLLVKHNSSDAFLQTMNYSVYYEINGEKEALSFDSYLMGVVAATMPAAYHTEALKAQAVIARTYALYNMSKLSESSPGKSRFSIAELGLPYCSPDSLKNYWGEENYSDNYSKLENAVYKTKDKVLLYQNTLILPLFFRTGSGYTRNASEAWGVEVPYLVSVPSKQDVTSTDYLTIQEYDLPDIITALTKYYTDITLTTEHFFEEVTVASRDSAGYVTKMNLGTLTVSGEEFAKVLGIASNHFYLEDDNNKVRIICNGSGHGIGLSQYGANAMASEERTYSDILTYYYTDTVLADLSK
jgi:stage II sporulation protein D